MTQAIRLGGRDGWAWTFDAVTYTINGQRHALPPMYSVFLSMFALWPGFPLSAQVAQVGLSVVSIALVFALGRRVHSTRAGLVAASLYALWVPNIFNVWSTSQETLYVPVILTAFLLLARAVDRDDPWPGFALAGVVFGAAALTRSMPMFFAVPAAVTHVLLGRNRRRASVQGLAFVLGFLLLTAPYSAALSRHFGQFTIIDTHGSIHLDSASGARAPSLFETAQGLWRAISARPTEYFAECLARARSLLHVNGGRILQIYVVADSKVGAVAWKTLVHLGSDAFLVIGAVLAGLGAALCQRPRIAIFLLLWTVINIGIASVGGFRRRPAPRAVRTVSCRTCGGRRRRWMATSSSAGAGRGGCGRHPGRSRRASASSAESAIVARLRHRLAIDFRQVSRPVRRCGRPQCPSLRWCRDTHCHAARHRSDPAPRARGWRPRTNPRPGRGRDSYHPNSVATTRPRLHRARPSRVIC